MKQYERETSVKLKDYTIELTNMFSRKSHEEKKEKKKSGNFVLTLPVFINNVFLPCTQFKRQHQLHSQPPVHPYCSLIMV